MTEQQIKDALDAIELLSQKMKESPQLSNEVLTKLGITPVKKQRIRKRKKR